MACGCRGGLRQEMIRVANSGPSASGYKLMSYPDCTTLHNGKYVGLSVYVVSRYTPDEKIFPRTMLSEASVYAKTVSGQIEALATADVCDQAVVDAYENFSL